MKRLCGTFSFGLALLLARSVHAADVELLKLANEGPARQLPQRILGAQASAFLEHLLDDPRKMEAYQAVRPSILRFPGGSYANFYNWRSGLVEIESHSGSSDYVKFWADLAPRIKRSHSNGVSLEDYMAFARKVDADLVLVPNLETSSVEEQVAWFKTLAEKHVLPKQIELGNEFWVAMMFDPDSLKRWPDVKTSMEIMHRYEQALRPLVGPGGKFAVQASFSGFAGSASSQPVGRLNRRLSDWNAGLKPEDWFEAVTMHLYPGPTSIMRHPDAKTPEGFFRLMMARVDASTERALAELARQLPGKGIWVTEWNPQGGNFKEHLPDLLTPDVLLHLGARMNLSILRQPAVTMSVYFMLFSSSNRNPSHVATAQGLEPLPFTQFYTWLTHAANGGATFQRVVEANGTVIEGLRAGNERYRGIEGAWFRSAKSATLILHNVTDKPRRLDLTTLERRPPQLAEAVVADKFDDTKLHPAHVVTLTVQDRVTLPALSVARLVWEPIGE